MLKLLHCGTIRRGLRFPVGPLAGCRNARGRSERSYDVRHCPDDAPAAQNPDVSGGAGDPRTRRVSRRLAPSQPGPKGRRSSGAGAARAGRLRHLDASAAQLPEEPRLCRQRVAAGGHTRPARAARVDRGRDLSDPQGRKISLIGWSLGGVYARQLAKMMPDRVRSVITLGSPFAGNPKATHAWRVYEIASGRRADEQPDRFGGSLSTTPPVPTTAIFSRTDGICAWQGCIEKPSARSENIEVESSHCGMGHHPAVVYAVADRLAQPEGKWAPFDRSGWRGMVYPDPNR